jgi:ubiquitin carboxyl-terminal hydrolase L5
VYSLDPATLETLQPVHALIFLFKWVGDTPQNQALTEGGNDSLKGEEITNPDDYLGLYFANQVSLLMCLLSSGTDPDGEGYQ